MDIKIGGLLIDGISVAKHRHLHKEISFLSIPLDTFTANLVTLLILGFHDC